jgi:hypothetical protein
VSRPVLSVIVCTARVDYPFVHHRDWHVLDKIVENCQKQTFKDFELIIVDLLYFHRPNYFSDAESKYNFKIIHIPDKKSIFRELKLPRISSSKNTGIIFSSGKHLVFSDDGQEWPDNALESLGIIARKRIGASCKFFKDEGGGPFEYDSRWVAYNIAGTRKSKCVNADLMGYFGGTLSMVSSDVMLVCNGWDEMFDGSRQLEDGDMAKRLGSYGCLMILNGEVEVVEHEMDSWVFNKDIVMPKVFLKCNGAYFYPIMFGRRKKRFIANDRLLTDEELMSYTHGKCRMISDGGLCNISNDNCLGKKWVWTTNPDDTRAVSEGRFNDIGFLKRVYQDKRLVFSLRKIRESVIGNRITKDELLFG